MSLLLIIENFKIENLGANLKFKIKLIIWYKNVEFAKILWYLDFGYLVLRCNTKMRFNIWLVGHGFYL
jgi:hypothetical protein